MKEQITTTIIDAKTATGVAASSSGMLIAVTEYANVVGAIVSVAVGIATLVYVCLGIRNRWKSKDDQE